MTMVTKYAAGVLVYCPSGASWRFLLLRNAKHGSWGFPKGHKNAGETDQECALRELTEETAIESVEIDEDFFEQQVYTVGIYEGPDFKKSVSYFLGATTNESFTISPEHDAAEFMTLENALKHLEHESQKSVLLKANEQLMMRSKKW